MSGRFVRAATAADAARIAEIYNQGIADRIATFETEPRRAADIAAWLARGDVVVVAGTAASVMAYAAAFPYRNRPCYDGVREFSVYAAREARGQGFGRDAMRALIEACRAHGWWKLLSRVFPENRTSLAMLAGLGFREVGTYRRHAQLDGHWRDVVIVEKLLDEA
jgi:phosphinothricin acetyltransferase